MTDTVDAADLIARMDAIEARAAALFEDSEALADTLDSFGAAFSVLSRLLLSSPDLEALVTVRGAELTGQWPVTGAEECARGVALLEESARRGEDETVIRRDYNRLFVGPERMKAPPYESVHRSKDRLVFEQETMQVRAAYAAFDLAAPHLNREPDDHIGLEFSFLASLCVRGLDALDAGDDESLLRSLLGIMAFLDEHLLAWGPQCMALIDEHATTAFYQGVAQAGLGTLAQAREVFGV